MRKWRGKSTPHPKAQARRQAARRTRTCGSSKGKPRLDPRRHSQFGTSRPVEARQGTGTIVREIGGDSSANPFAGVLKRKAGAVREAFDLRKMLAGSASGHARQSRGNCRTRLILKRQEEKQNQGEAAVSEDAEFHYNVALASGNTVVLKVIDIIMDLLRETRTRLQVDGRAQKSFEGHRRILASIQHHDWMPQTAMLRHIEDVEEIVLGNF